MTTKVTEALHILQEECAEVIQAISKINRFGIDSVYEGKTNKEMLIAELGDVMALVTYITDAGFLDKEEIELASKRKVEKMKIWTNLYT